MVTTLSTDPGTPAGLPGSAERIAALADREERLLLTAESPRTADPSAAAG